MNALQHLIHQHCEDSGETLAQVANRGGLSRQTLSAIAHRDDPGGFPRRSTLEGLAKGLGVSLAIVEHAAALAASQTADGEATQGAMRLKRLIDAAERLDDKDLQAVTQLARALGK